MDGKAMASALLTSFNALVAVAPPSRLVPALQRALRDLLEEPAPARSSGTTPRPPKKNRSRWVGNLEVWSPLRTRVLTVLAVRGMTRRELAGELGIAHATLKPSLSPRGPVPSKANLARLQGWLNALEARDNGAARNGHAAAAHIELPRKLTVAQRERLAAHVELDGRALCKTIGIDEDGIGIAISGGDVSGEAFDRLTNFLQQQQPAAPGP